MSSEGCDHSKQIRVSGFTLVRNGVRFGYPFQESLLSLLPLVDELVVNVGVGEDDTREKVQALAAHPDSCGKIRVIESRWPLDDPQKRQGGAILAEQTNLALDHCRGEWCFYLQADEVLHEEDYPAIQQSLLTAEADPRVEGLLFDYVHFYGSYDVVQVSRSAYRREVRCVRRSARPRSVGDAQSFRRADGSKLWVMHSGARVFHYGWVRPPEVMREKTVFMDGLYHGEQASKGNQPYTGNNYRYKRFWGLQRYTGTHPAVMSERIAEKGWHWDLDASPMVWTWKDLKKIVLDTLEKWTGYRFFEYRSYRLLRPRHRGPAV